MERIVQEDYKKDAMLGEYERPVHLAGRRRMGTCAECGEVMYYGEEAHWFDIDNDGNDELVCAECAHQDAVLDAVFAEKSMEEKLWILEAI